MTSSTLPLAPGAEAPTKYPAAEPDRDLSADVLHPVRIRGAGVWSAGPPVFRTARPERAPLYSAPTTMRPTRTHEFNC